MHLLINIDVPDLPAAEALYTQAFGLSAGRRFGDGGVELLGAQAPIYLLQNAAGSIAAADMPRDYTRHWTPVHLDVVVDSLRSARPAGRFHAGTHARRHQLDLALVRGRRLPADGLRRQPDRDLRRRVPLQ